MKALQRDDVVLEALPVGLGVVEGREHRAVVGDVETGFGRPQFPRHAVRHVHPDEVFGGGGCALSAQSALTRQAKRGSSGAERRQRSATRKSTRAHWGFLLL